MSLRHITAGLLIVLLLCGAGLTGACALRCGLVGGAKGCGGHGSDGTPVALSSMGCHGMNAAGESVDAISSAATLCSHAIASVAVADEGPGPLFGEPHGMVVASVLTGVDRPRVMKGATEMPLRSASGSPRNLVSLRV